MRICTVGAGAIGGFIAAGLGRVNQETSVLARGATLRAIRADGLADHLDPVLECGQHRLESFDDHLVVIDEDKSYRGRHGTTVCKF